MTSLSGALILIVTILLLNTGFQVEANRTWTDFTLESNRLNNNSHEQHNPCDIDSHQPGAFYGPRSDDLECTAQQSECSICDYDTYMAIPVNRKKPQHTALEAFVFVFLLAGWCISWIGLEWTKQKENSRLELPSKELFYNDITTMTTTTVTYTIIN